MGGEVRQSAHVRRRVPLNLCTLLPETLDLMQKVFVLGLKATERAIDLAQVSAV